MEICGDYEIGMYQQICTDIETASHELARRMKYFAKVDFKSANNQIEIDEKFKEITPLNTIGVLK